MLFGIDKIGSEIEGPFGKDSNDLHLKQVLRVLDHDLATLVAIANGETHLRLLITLAPHQQHKKDVIMYHKRAASAKRHADGVVHQRDSLVALKKQGKVKDMTEPQAADNFGYSSHMFPQQLDDDSHVIDVNSTVGRVSVIYEDTDQTPLLEELQRRSGGVVPRQSSVQVFGSGGVNGPYRQGSMQAFVNDLNPTSTNYGELPQSNQSTRQKARNQKWLMSQDDDGWHAGGIN